MTIKGLLLTVLAAAQLAQPAVARVSDTLTDKIHVRAQAAGFDGAILIGDRDGSSRVLTLGPKQVAPDAVWHWASITKQLAATIAMQEVARGRLDLDAPIARYWPDWKAPNAGTIRIRDLLMHKSGLPQPDESPADADGVPGFYRAQAASPQESANGFCAGPARAAPPAKFEYNNCDTIVLAEILRRITGHPFDRLARDRVARPLGMARFGLFRFGKPPARHVAPNGEFSKEDALLNLGAYGASGGAYGTITDLWRFDRALLSGKLLADKERELMWESNRSNGFYGFHQWIFPATLKGCGKEMRIVERQGLIGGIELRNYLIPQTGQAVILFSRHRPSDFGDPWEGKGLAFDILSQMVCP